MRYHLPLRSALALTGLFVLAAPALAQNNPDFFKLQTVFQATAGKCFNGNISGSQSAAGGGAFMDDCGKANGSGMEWLAVSAANGFFQLKIRARGEDKCLEGNRVAPESALQGAAFMESCANTQGQLWKAVPLANGSFRLKTQYLGDNKCLEGNQLAPGSFLSGAAFMDDCRDVPGQEWKLIGGTLVDNIPQPYSPLAVQSAGECRFYEHDNYNGNEWILKANHRVHWYDEVKQKAIFTPAGNANPVAADIFDSTSGANGAVSSAKIIGNCKAILWESPFENGRTVTLTSDTSSFTSIDFNDIASEAECICITNEPSRSASRKTPPAMPSSSSIVKSLSIAPAIHIKPSERLRFNDLVQRRDLRRASPSIEIQSINFASGSAAIEIDQFEKVKQISEALSIILKGNPAARFLIEGHTDAVGTDSSNQALSQQRAKALKDALIKHFQITEQSLYTIGFGERDLLILTDQAEWQNRRVTLRRIDQFLHP